LIPAFLIGGDRQDRLKLNQLATTHYSLDQANEVFTALATCTDGRSVITFSDTYRGERRQLRRQGL
jgi:hypothetical protein